MSRRAKGEGAVHRDGGIVFNNQYEHILKAEKAVGHKLPSDAEVHHVDKNRSNNKGSNLVICPNPAYHKLLHRRTEALEACSNPNYIKCTYCKLWDSPEKLIINSGRDTHRECYNKYHRELKRR